MGQIENGDISDIVLQMLAEQKEEWKIVGERFEALKHNQVRTLALNERCHVLVQFNPARIRSSKADITPEALAKRRCFLCPEGRDVLQRTYPLGDYGVQVNPFPIFPVHFTVTYNHHVPQCILGRFGDYLAILKSLGKLTVFYNGPHSGASAPDHCHFQACTRGIMPIEKEWLTCPSMLVKTRRGGQLLQVKDYLRTLFVLQGTSIPVLENLFEGWLATLPVKPHEYEPRLNLLGFYEDKVFTVFLLPRDRMRPACFYANDDSQRTVSPASVEMGGLFITPVEKDFRLLSAADAIEILHECTMKL